MNLIYRIPPRPALLPRFKMKVYLKFYFLHSTFKIFFFLMWTIFKVPVQFVKALFLFYVLVHWPQGMWDPRTLTRDGTCTPSIGKQSPITGPPGTSWQYLFNINKVFILSIKIFTWYLPLQTLSSFHGYISVLEQNISCCFSLLK